MSTYKFLGPLYRHFSEQKYSLDFQSGEYIRISTLSACREYEDPDQGDAGEATYSYSHSPIDNSHPDFQVISRRCGINIAGNFSGRVIIEGTEVSSKIDDAYVLCLAFSPLERDLHEKFGAHLVKIHHAAAFIQWVIEAVRSAVPLKTAFFGPVKYMGRDFRDVELLPGHIGFVKPVFPYARQREYRIIFHCEPGHSYKPFGVKVANMKSISDAYTRSDLV